jgi:hypothetical protein
MREMGHTFTTIARDIPMWDENDLTKASLTGSHVKAWYEKSIGGQAHKAGRCTVSINDAKRYATKAEKTQPVEEKLNHIARAIYEMARALEDIERRLINME